MAAAKIGSRMAVLKAGKAKMDGSIAQLRNEVASCHQQLLSTTLLEAMHLPPGMRETRGVGPWGVRG